MRFYFSFKGAYLITFLNFFSKDHGFINESSIHTGDDVSINVKSLIGIRVMYIWIEVINNGKPKKT